MRDIIELHVASWVSVISCYVSEHQNMHSSFVVRRNNMKDTANHDASWRRVAEDGS